MSNRYLRSGFVDSARINNLSAEAERLFCRLLVHVDDHGRCEADPMLLLGKLFSRQLNKITPQQISDWLAELMASKLAYVYASPSGNHYLQMNKWDMRCCRTKRSEFPEPPRNIKDCLQVYVPLIETVKKSEPIAETRLSPAKRRMNRLYNRRDETQWSDKERIAANQLAKRPYFTDELGRMEVYFAAMRADGRGQFLRHDMITLFNNWAGELDRAATFKPEHKGQTDKKLSSLQRDLRVMARDEREAFLSKVQSTHGSSVESGLRSWAKQCNML